MLYKKMIRDLKKNGIQFLSIFIMTCLAMIVVCGFDSSDHGTSASAADYFEMTKYKDIDISGSVFTNKDLEMLELVDGISGVDGLLSFQGKTILDKERPLLVSFISSNKVSEFYVMEGKGFNKGSHDVWLEYRFAEAMNIHPGDKFSYTIDNKSYEKTVAGTIYYSEYMYYIPNTAYTEPEYGEHGFIIMDIGEAPVSSDMYDHLIVDLTDVSRQGKRLTSKDEKIMLDMKSVIMKKFDNTKLLVRTKTEDDIYTGYIHTMDANTVLSTIFLVIFMSAASLGIITTMTRLTSNQRIQIGTMKALGFSRKKIIYHYMSYSVSVTFLGAVIGAIIGIFALGSYINSITDYYYQNPLIRLQPTLKSIWMILLAVGICAVVTYVSTIKILKQNASEILRQEAPKSIGTGVLERFPFWKNLTFASQWNIRDVRINKLRTAVSIFGILVCSMLLFSAVGFSECLHAVSGWMYGELIRSDFRITLEDDIPYEAAYDYSKEYSGQLVEYREVTLFTDSAESVREIMVLDEGNLYTLQDEKLKFMEVPDEGVIITSRITDLLGVKKGDRIRFRVAGDSKVYSSYIAGICRQASNQGIIMSRKSFEKLGGTFLPNLIYTKRYVPEDLKKKVDVSSVETKELLREAQDNVNSTGYAVTAILIVMGVAMGSVVLYNLGVLSYIEKVREIATLKVLGFQSLNIRYILLQQNLVVTAIGALLGIPLGKAVLDVMVDLFAGTDTDITINITFVPYICAVLGTFLVSVIINVFISSKVKSIDMVEALKGVE